MTESPASTLPSSAPLLFVIHAAADEWFVRGAMIPQLALPPNAVLATSQLGLGKMALAELERGIASAVATVVVISQAFLADAWSGLASLLASHLEIDGRGQVVPVLLEEVSSPLYLAAKVALDLRDRASWAPELARLRELVGAPAPASEELTCPYPGMRPFGAADAARFYGREREIVELVSRVRAGEREILVVGPSGSGKSSLVTAGAMPRLARGVFGMPKVVLRALRPGATPTARLGEVLGQSEVPLCGAWRSCIDALAGGDEARIVLFIDQLEELFTLAPAAERARFCAAIAELRADERVTLLWGMRADFLGELMESELWPASLGAGLAAQAPRAFQLSVAPLRGDALRAAVLRPALDVGVVFEPGLLERLLADAAGEPGALPLLQETLVQLWERRVGRVLAIAEYLAMADGERHGIAVAISRHGDACLRALPPAPATVARRILLRLVSLPESPTGAPERRDAKRPQTEAALALGEEPASFDAALEALAKNRLVTIDRTTEGVTTVDLAHEALLTAWPMLAGLVRTARRDEVQRRRLCAKVAEWQERRTSDGTAGLLDAFELAEAESFLERELEHGLGSVPGLADLVLQSRVARNAAIRRGHESRPPRLVVPGERPGNRDGKDASIAATLGRQRANWRALAFSPDGTRVAAAAEDTTARVWDAQNGEPLSPLLPHRAPVASLAFSADGSCLVTAAEDQTARVWDAQSGAALSPPLVHDDLLWSAALSPKGSRVVTACGDRAARIWDVGEGVLSIPPLLHDDAVRCAAFSRRGDRVVTASADGTARVWDATSGRPLGAPMVHRDVVVHAAFHPDGHFVVTASRDQTACIWETETGKLAAPPLLHDAPVETVEFAPDGRSLVTASLGYTLHRFRVEVERRRAQRPTQVWGPALEAATRRRSAKVGEVGASQPDVATEPSAAPPPPRATARGSLPPLPRQEGSVAGASRAGPTHDADIAKDAAVFDVCSVSEQSAPAPAERTIVLGGSGLWHRWRVLRQRLGRWLLALLRRSDQPALISSGDGSTVPPRRDPVGEPGVNPDHPTVPSPEDHGGWVELVARWHQADLETLQQQLALQRGGEAPGVIVGTAPWRARADSGPTGGDDIPSPLRVVPRVAAPIQLPLVVRDHNQVVVQVQIAGMHALATLADGRVCVLDVGQLLDDTPGQRLPSALPAKG